MFWDTHAHFEEVVRDGQLDDVMARASEAGVARIVAVGGTDAANAAALKAARAYPDRILPAIGYDREVATQLAVTENLQTDAAEVAGRLRGVLTDVKPAAIGELGLDFHYHPETRLAQEALLEAQLALARELKLPCIVHTREADAETLEILAHHAAGWKGERERIGVVHCFTGGADFARRLVELGFRISFSGIVTFKNADSLRAVAAGLPEDAILIETDTPYLTPVPMRAKPNEPAYVRFVAAQVAKARGVTVEEVGATTSRNAARLFGVEGLKAET